MKTYKKILFGLSLIAALISALLLFHISSSQALSAPIPYQGTGSKPSNKVEFWQTCAYRVAFNQTGGVLDYCVTDPGPNGSNTFNYGGSSTSSIINSAFAQSTYQTSYGPIPPGLITLLNDSGQPLVTAQTVAQSLAWNSLSYTGQSFTAGSAPQTQEIKFYVYQPGPAALSGSNYSFLASMNSAGSLQVLALVYNVPTKNKVFAVPINVTAVGSTKTGAVCTTNDTDPSCGQAPAAKVTAADTSACVFQTNSQFWEKSLGWIICPFINGLSASADGINSFVESQLNFSVHENLSGSVHNAWAVFRTITSAILVIIILIMVLSQAIGGGPFEAYTIRKMLPRLVAAVIIMQVSWQLCIFLITLSNHAGSGIAQLLAAPFGGTSNLDLASLLHRLNGAWAAAIGAGTWAGVITGLVFAGPILAFGWPILVLAVILILISLIVALATLLFRNALIVLLVILSPLAFLAYVLPGTQSYWKMWKDNFTRLLLFFPMVMAMIYGGRIFAWTAGNLGSAGPLDVIMVILGFFGPYFFLPKTFKWGGNFLSAASKAVNESWPVKKSRETATKGLMGRQQREINKWAKDLDPTRDGYVRKTGGKRFGIIPNFEGSLAKTALWNARAGRIIPTKRGLASAIQRGETWNSEEDAIAAAKVKREQDKAAGEDPNNPKGNPTFTYQLGPDGKVRAELSDNATARGKAALFNAAGRADAREAGVAAERALKTSSWVEMGKNLVPVSDPVLQDTIKKSGAEIFEGDENDPAQKGKIFVRMYDLPRYNSKVNASEDLYPLPLGKFLLATPHITNPENKPPAAEIARLQRQENEAAAREGREPRRIQKPHHIQRAIDVINGYLDAGNITSQSEAEYQELGRLARQDPDVSVAFGQLLHRIAHGGQGGINVLTQLNSSASMKDTMAKLLASGVGHDGIDKESGEIVPHLGTLEGYLQEGQANITRQQRGESPGGTVSDSGGDNDGGGGTRDTGGGGGERSGGGGSREAGGGFKATGESTTPGSVSFGPTSGAGPTSGPIELNIDHDALSETIREASRLGTKQGLKQALREQGGHQPGEVFRPDTPQEPSDQTHPDEDNT